MSLATMALKRRDRFASRERYARLLTRLPFFRFIPRAAIQLFAEKTLRPAQSGTGFELCCPREYEAQVFEFIFVWSMTVDFGRVSPAR